MTDITQIDPEIIPSFAVTPNVTFLLIQSEDFDLLSAGKSFCRFLRQPIYGKQESRESQIVM